MAKIVSFLLVALLSLACARPAGAAQEKTLMDREVNALLGELRASACRFNRNGTWYGGADASQHLAKKYDYLRSRLASTEQFIEKGASTSSMSGKHYLVQCGDAKAVTSREWLTAELEALRASGVIEEQEREAREEREREEREEREKRE
ncbi:MAG TPA: DUF5329 domain-containing protein [Xanthomonadales bacterium]|nr:DUF5329 domain-containing protein [Xanthomonadales bacterium]